jgi:predicted metal-dependent phosphoesterase TrpH
VEELELKSTHKLKMKKYALHLHTKHSKCSNCEPKKILEITKNQNFSGIAITDHNTIRGALETKKLNKDNNFEIIIGEEVSTDIGHVLIYYVEETIMPGNVEDVIREAREQKSICVLAHPYNLISSKIGELLKYKGFRKTLSEHDADKVELFDALEGFNARCLLKRENILSQQLAQSYKKPVIAGSDAHFPNEIGNAWVEFDDEYSVRQAILQGKIKLKGKRKYTFINKLHSTLRTLLK